MSVPARSTSPPLNAATVRAALEGIGGVVEVRVVEDRYVYVILADHDMDRDDQIVKALLELDPEPADFFLVSTAMAGTVPDGVRAT